MNKIESLEIEKIKDTALSLTFLYKGSQFVFDKKYNVLTSIEEKEEKKTKKIKIGDDEYYYKWSLDLNRISKSNDHKQNSENECERIKQKLKDKIITTLDIPDEGQWSVCDVYGDLIIIHYKGNNPPQNMKKIRGIILDISDSDNKDILPIVADSYGQPQTFIMNSLDIRKGRLFLTGEENGGDSIIINKGKFQIYEYYEGTIMRVFLYKGKVYASTHRKIMPFNSKWRNSNPFMYSYLNSGGFMEELFESDKEFSPFCYCFMIESKDTLNISKKEVRDNKIIYIGVRLMWEKDENSPFDNTKYKIESVKEGFGLKFLLKQETLEKARCFKERKEVNDFLKYGFYKEEIIKQKIDDSLMFPGEAIIVFYQKENSNEINVAKVFSHSYQRRKEILCGYNQKYGDMKMRFFQLIKLARKNIISNEKHIEVFFRNMMIINNITYNTLKTILDEKGSIIFLPCSNNMKERDGKDIQYKQELIWLNYLISLPHNLQREALDYLIIYRNSIENIVDWTKKNIKIINELEYSRSILPNGEVLVKLDLDPISSLTKTTPIILTDQMKSYLEKIKEKYSPKESLDQNKIKRFISNEMTGIDLYRLYKDIDKTTRKKQQKNSISIDEMIENLKIV